MKCTRRMHSSAMQKVFVSIFSSTRYRRCAVPCNRSITNLHTVTYFLTFLLNLGRIRKITLTEQFIMAYGGLRGAIAFSLSLTLNPAMLEGYVSARLCRVGLLFGNARRIQTKKVFR